MHSFRRSHYAAITRKNSKTKSHKTSNDNAKLLEISREFNVPVSQLFDAFTSSQAIKTWWWPKDLYADEVRYNFKVGGKYFINMKGLENAGGGGMIGTFEEIEEGKRIVMSDQFADLEGNPITPEQAKMKGVWPELVYITFEFEALDKNNSRFQLSQEGIPNELQDDCYQGWNQSFDKLETYLSGRKN